MLVTAFDAFGDLEVNPSQVLLERLTEQMPELVPVVLPTSYRRGWAVMHRAIREERPSAILMLGYSRAVDGLRLEQYGHNTDASGQPDNDGRLGTDTILQGAPQRLEATVSVSHLARQLKSPLASVSTSAGGYVCNNLYLRTLAMLKAEGIATPCVFVHVGDWEGEPSAAGIVTTTVALIRAIS